MPRPTGILGAIGAIILAIALFGVMLWVIGQPSLVSWWRAEYLIGGFVALLIGAVVLANPSKKSAIATAGETGVAISFGKGIGIALGAVLLLLILYAVVR